MRMSLLKTAVSLTLTLVLLATGWGCTQMSAEEKKAEHVTRGQAYFTEEKYREALIEYKNVVQIDPKDAGAHYQLALIHMKLGGMTELQAAFGELAKSVDLDPSNQDAQIKLSEFYLMTRQPEKARQHADIVLASAPQDPKGHLLRGRSLIIEKEFNQGVEEFQQAIELDADNVNTYIDLAKAYIGMKDTEAAFDTLNQGLAKHPKSVELILALGDISLVTGKADDAEAQYRKAIELDPENEALSIKLARFYQFLRKWEQAEETLLLNVKNHPQSDVAQVQMGEFYVYLGQRDKAITHFQQALDLKPESESAQEKIITYYLDGGQIEQAEPLIQAILEKDKKNLLGRVTNARVKVMKGTVAEAIADLQRVVKEEPRMAIAHHYLGVAFAANNDGAQAVRELSEAVKLDPSMIPARNALAGIRLAEGSYDLAIEQAQAAFKLNPRNLPSVRVLAEAFFRKGEIAKAKKVYEAIVGNIPTDASSHYRLGLISGRDKDLKGALGHFEKAVEGNPNFVQAVSQIAAVYLTLGKAEQARERVMQQIKVVPENPLFHNLLGGLWMQAKNMEEAEQSFRDAINIDDAVQISYMNLAELYRRTDRVDEAVKEYEMALVKNPKLVSAHMMLGMIAEKRDDLSGAKQHYQESLKINESFAPAANNLAWILAEEGTNLDEALSYAQIAREQAPSDPNIADTLGWIYYKKNAYLKAVSFLNEAADKLQDNPIIHYHLGMTQLKKGDTAAAKKALNTALKLSDKFPGVEEAKKALAEL
ncbi:MAG: tetratricopeptide repeat protein [Nitrospirae bacterium]|nr:tetratricopeptide repeat protein [Nitrospirota bacterium]MDA1304599.1 tetratricopeptide repeat protein [Nitrospirota bacterium]